MGKRQLIQPHLCSLFHSCLRKSRLRQMHIWHLKKRVLSQYQAHRGRESAAQAGKTTDFQHQISH
jgi:hypothetical protein